MQAPEQVYADVLRTLYRNNMIDFDLLDRKVDELQIMLFKRELKDKRSK
jgi:hypothetical protein